MKRDTINYFAVGGFVLAGFIALGAVLLAVTGQGGPEDDYVVRYRNVSGIRIGTPVFYEGYRIGQVQRIEPEHEAEGTRYRVTLAVQRDWPIPDDSIAAALATGLLGDVSIAISEGKSAQRLDPGGEIKGREGGDLFVAFNELAVEVQSLTRDSIRPMVDQLAQHGGPMMAELHQMIAKLNKSADGLNAAMSPQNQREFAELLRHFNETSANAAQLSSDLLETRKSLDSALNNLDATSQNLREFSREIRANPNRLLSSQPPDDEAKK